MIIKLSITDIFIFFNEINHLTKEYLIKEYLICNSENYDLKKISKFFFALNVIGVIQWKIFQAFFSSFSPIYNKILILL